MTDVWVDTDQSLLGSYESTVSYEDYVFCGAFSASESYTCDRVGIYSHADPLNDPYVKLAIYADSGGAPNGSPLAETAQFQITGGSQWFDVDISDVSITSGTTYHVAHITSAAPTTQWRYRLPSAANPSYYETPITWPNFPSSPDSGPSSRRYGAYRMGYAGPPAEHLGLGMFFKYASNQYLTGVNTFNTPTNCTICFWEYPTSLTGLQRAIGSDDYFEVKTVDNKLHNDLYGELTLISVANIQLNTLYHFACTINSTTNFGEIYINGVLDNSDNANVQTPTGTTLEIGHRPGDLEYFDGYLQDMRMYDRVLTANEIATIYGCKGTDGIVDGLLYRWLFDEGAAGTAATGVGTVKDQMGNMNMTPSNSPVYSGSRLKLKRFV